jgi:sugar phosphate isomerase/epimerase
MELNNWPVGISTGMFLHFPLSRVLEPIKKAGFNLIEVSAFPGHFNYHDIREVTLIRQQLDETGLKVCSLHAPYSLELDLTSLNEENRQKAVKEMETAAEALSRLGGRTLVLHAGSEDQNITDPPQIRLEQSVKSLREICSYCQKWKITLAIEDMLGHLLGGRTRELQWLLGQLSQDGAGMCLDTGHSFLTGQLMERMIAFAPYLVMLHIHDNRGEYDDHLPPGEGKIDWSAVLQALRAISFDGELVLELKGGEDPFSVLDKATESISYLRNL